MFQPKWKNNTKETRSTYSVWCGMRNRCTNPNSALYRRYGGRGISVCERWLNDYDAFVEDMGLKPPGLSIDRIDNDGNYEPENCRWATPKEQMTNTRANHRITRLGVTRTISEWADELNLCRNTIYERHKRGLSVDLVLSRKSLVPELRHGTTSMYVMQKCRCDDCRKANSDYMKKNRHRFPSMSSSYRKEKYRARKT